MLAGGGGGADAGEHRRRGAGGDWFAAGEPVGEFGVRQFEDGLDLVQLGRGHGGDAGGDEAADQQVVFISAAMPGAEDQPAAPVVQWCRGFRGFERGHLQAI